MVTFVGCASAKIGTKFDPVATRDYIKVNMTTKEDIIKLLGRPWGKGSAMFDDSEEEVWSYMYGETSYIAGKTDVKDKMFYIFFDVRV